MKEKRFLRGDVIVVCRLSRHVCTAAFDGNFWVQSIDCFVFEEHASYNSRIIMAFSKQGFKILKVGF